MCERFFSTDYISTNLEFTDKVFQYKTLFCHSLEDLNRYLPIYELIRVADRFKLIDIYLKNNPFLLS